MSEIDDILSADAAQAAAYRAEVDLAADHGSGWEVITVAPDLRDFVADFVTRIPATAGTPAYWVQRGGGVTVHVAPERIPRFRRVPKETRAANERRQAAWKNEGHNDARLLVLIVASRGEFRDRAYPFVELNGTWSPARARDGSDDWSWATDAKEAMVSFVRAQQR